MDPLTIATLAATAYKMYNDNANSNSQRKVSAETARWSPWTHMQAEPVKNPDLGGTAMQGALTAYMMGRDGKVKPDDGSGLGKAYQEGAYSAGNSSGAANMSVGQPGNYRALAWDQMPYPNMSVGRPQF